MEIKVFSLLDTKTGIYNAPFFMAHIGLAVRAVAELAADLNTTVGRHPADFMLVDLGSFDDQTGAFRTSVPVSLGTAVSFLEHDRPRSAELPFTITGSASETPTRVNGGAA